MHRFAQSSATFLCGQLAEESRPAIRLMVDLFNIYSKLGVYPTITTGGASPCIAWTKNICKNAQLGWVSWLDFRGTHGLYMVIE